MEPSRYLRQLPIPCIGSVGQRTLAAAHVLVVGCGGLGSPLLYALCGMGVGHITFADGDTVSLSNLNRQHLHTVSDIGRNKAASAREKLAAYNPDIALTAVEHAINADNIGPLLVGCDAVALAVDTLAARLAVNRACVQAGIPLIDGGVNGFLGAVTAVFPQETACLECLYGGTSQPDEAPSAIASVTGIVAGMEAQLTLLTLLGQRTELANRLFVFDGARLSLETLTLAKSPRCPLCGKG